MPTDSEPALVDLLIEEGFNRGNLDIVDEHVSPDFKTDQLPPDVPAGPGGLKAVIGMWRGSFPYLRFTSDEKIGEPGKVVNRWTVRGTHDGEFFGIAPTGRKIETTGVTIWYFRDNKIVSTWVSFDALGLPDHLLYRHDSGVTEGSWECCSMLAAIAAVTTRVNLGTIVICTAFRNPALLAKIADTIDEISGGRLILGLGAGYHEPKFSAFCYPYDHLFSRFREALQIVHGLLRHGELDFEGEYYTVRDCELRPRGPRPEGPPILIGARSPKMLQLTAEYADLWQPEGQLIESGDDAHALFRTFQTQMNEACEALGCDPSTLCHTGALTINPLNRSQFARASLRDAIGGTPEEIVGEILAWRDLGCSHMILGVGPASVEGIEAMAPVLEILHAA